MKKIKNDDVGCAKLILQVCDCSSCSPFLCNKFSIQCCSSCNGYIWYISQWNGYAKVMEKLWNLIAKYKKCRNPARSTYRIYSTSPSNHHQPQMTVTENLMLICWLAYLNSLWNIYEAQTIHALKNSDAKANFSLITSLNLLLHSSNALKSTEIPYYCKVIITK